MWNNEAPTEDIYSPTKKNAEESKGEPIFLEGMVEKENQCLITYLIQ
jgi:hypothetical protein